MRPAQLAAIMRPELPDLAREIISEIRSRIPEYARPMDGPYGHVLQVAVERALASFFDWIADQTAPRDRRDQLCRTLGQYEAQEGRSLDSLQAAYRIGVHVAWRRVMSTRAALAAHRLRSCHGLPMPYSRTPTSLRRCRFRVTWKRRRGPGDHSKTGGSACCA